MSDDNDTGETARGVVFQLPGRDRKPRFISGIADPNNDGCAILSLEIFDDKEDAARNADSLAEMYADKERDYQRAWCAGQEYSELGESIAQDRRDVLALIREVKANCTTLDSMPRVRAEIESAILEYLNETATRRDKRAELLRDYGDESAFKEH
jgi:hypothetical protein